jgi:hypothetical protein
MFINPIEQVLEDNEIPLRQSASVPYTEKSNNDNKREFTMHKKHIKTTTVEHYTYSGVVLDPALLLRLLEYATEHTDDSHLHLIVERANKLCYQQGCEFPLGMLDYPALVAPAEGTDAMDTMPMPPAEA